MATIIAIDMDARPFTGCV